MNFLHKLFFSAFIFIVSSHGVCSDSWIFGSVFCDRCKDGALSFYDYPMNGIGVRVSCMDRSGRSVLSEEVTTNWFGSYVIWIGGGQDLSNCYTYVSSSKHSLDLCRALFGPAQRLSLMFDIFGREMYRVGTLLTQPVNPMPYCYANSVSSFSGPTSEGDHRASACSSRDWAAAEHRCYWKVVKPETTVGSAFGAVAARRYGGETTLGEGLRGRGDGYRTLLREATTALLNSYNDNAHGYQSMSVVAEMNEALMKSERDVLHTALRFIRANKGHCNFTSCPK